MSLLLLLLSRFSRVQLYATPETAAHQAPPSLGFSRQEHWSGLSFPSPRKAECQRIDTFELWCRRLTEKAMAPHSSTLAWKIPWTEEPGGLQSMGSLRVGHD